MSRELLPLDAGEQYRFAFAMESCVGCHSCEAACAEQNGLPPEIAWRRVGRDRGRHVPRHQAASTCRCRATTASSRPASRAAPPTPTSSSTTGRRPPGRRVHRLPVLHLELPVLGPGLPARPAHRHEVRHVPAPPRGRAGAGLRRRLPDVRDHGREGRTSPPGGRTTRPATPRNLPSSDLTLSTTRYRAARPTCRSRPTAAASGRCGPRTRTGRWCGSRCSPRPRSAPASPPGHGRAADRPPWLAVVALRRLAPPPRPAGPRLEGAAQPAPLVAVPRGGAVRRLRRAGRAGRRRARRRPRWRRSSARPGCTPAAGSTWCPGRPAWHSPLTLVRFAATGAGHRSAAHRPPGRGPSSASSLQALATAANLVRLARGDRDRVVGRGPPHARLVPAWPVGAGLLGWLAGVGAGRRGPAPGWPSAWSPAPS